MDQKKNWRVDIAPITFFLIVVLGKTYFLIEYLQANEQAWDLVAGGGESGAVGSGIRYYLTGHFSYLLYYLTALAFDALVLFSFLVRKDAVERPKGFWENVFPLVTVFVPVLGFTLLFVPDVRQVLPNYPESLLRQMAEWSPSFPFYINLLGTLVGLTGAAFSVWAILHLKSSFGLRTAVRKLVTTGPYRRIRHPLYFGEIIHVVGIAILAATPAALFLLVISVALQAIRAKVEERKFLASVPEYAEFRDATGFLWPRFR